MKRIGTQRPLGEEERESLLLDLGWWRERSRQFYASRSKAEEAFYCVWDGQHSDGTVHDEKDALAWPFDGASDQRVRWGEKVVLDKIALVMIALSSCEVEFACGAGPEGERATGRSGRTADSKRLNVDPHRAVRLPCHRADFRAVSSRVRGV